MSRHAQALPMQAFHIKNPEQRLAADVVPAVDLASHRVRDEILLGHRGWCVLAGSAALEGQPGNACSGAP